MIFVPARSCLLKGLLVLRLAHRVTCLTNSQARSCLLKGLLVLQPSATHRVTYLANSRLDSLFGPIAKSTETCSQQRNLLCISNIDNWCLHGLLFCRLLVVMLYIDSLVTRPFHSSGFLARSSSLICWFIGHPLCGENPFHCQGCSPIIPIASRGSSYSSVIS